MKISRKVLNRPVKTAVSLALAVLVTGCASTEMLIEKRNLQVTTQNSETIYLDPVSNNQKTVYIAIKNTSDQTLNVVPQLTHAFAEKGYKVVSNPNSAHYLLQANVLQVGNMSKSASKSALGGGYGSAIAGAATGAAIGSFSHNANTMLAGGIAGGVVGLVADSLVKDVNFTVITDVQVSERVGRGQKVQEDFNASLSNGTASRSYQTSTRNSDFQRYRTRIVSYASQVNLTFAKARPALEEGLAKALSGIF